MIVGCHGNTFPCIPAIMRIFLEMFELNLLQFIHNMFCKNIASFAVAKYRIHV